MLVNFKFVEFYPFICLIAPFLKSDFENTVMSEQNRSAYMDFVRVIDGISTSIRIFETHTHVFVYVNQFPEEMNLFSDMLKGELMAKCKGMRHKEFGVVCNLANKEALIPVSENIIKILTE